jgi:hypothetical protein
LSIIFKPFLCSLEVCLSPFKGLVPYATASNYVFSQNAPIFLTSLAFKNFLIIFLDELFRVFNIRFSAPL